MKSSGVNFVGDWLLDTGMGVASRSMMRACLENGIPISAVPWHNVGNPSISESAAGFPNLPSDSLYPINIISHNIHLVAATSYQDVQSACKGKYTIGNWYWELSTISDSFAQAFDRIDEVWVSSAYVRDCFATATDKPITIIPPFVEVHASGRFTREYFDLDPQAFIFLFSFNAGSCATRKNPWAVIDAYQTAFSSEARENKPILVIKATNASQYPEFETILRARCGEVGAVLIDRNLSREEMDDLLDCSDAYISLHRSEGFGLGMAEAMKLGKPVIGTNYSGNVDFMTEENSYPISFKLITVADTPFRGDESFRTIFSDPNGVWAEADVNEAAEAMRQIVDNPSESRARAARASETISNYCGTKSVGQRITQRLCEIEESHLTHARNVVTAARLASLVRELESKRTRQAEIAAQLEALRNKIISVSGSIPILSGFLRILLRPLFLGRLLDLQIEASQLQQNVMGDVTAVINEIQKDL